MCQPSQLQGLYPKPSILQLARATEMGHSIRVRAHLSLCSTQILSPGTLSEEKNQKDQNKNHQGAFNKEVRTREEQDSNGWYRAEESKERTSSRNSDL
ncbi:hypothetical protein TURU_155328 [Turdus rufiventris]|nr:hypothetical protein TURU_155328 [Turdus rufiventris]